MDATGVVLSIKSPELFLWGYCPGMNLLSYDPGQTCQDSNLCIGCISEMAMVYPKNNYNRN